ncbi:MAG: hypothetical protein HZA50_06365 [Planctomycetes bacterium]|nr:hypothetical protein [Planctomycetota bacterium]
MLGQLLLVLEMTAATILASAFITACSTRTKSFFIELLLWPPFLSFAIAPWVTAIVSMLLLDKDYPEFVFLLISFYVGAAVFLIATIWIMIRGFKKQSGNPTIRRGAKWRLPPLIIAFGAACACFTLTFFLWDIHIQGKMETVKDEACRIAEELTPKPIPDKKNTALLYQQAIKLLDCDQKCIVKGKTYFFTNGELDSNINKWLTELDKSGKPCQDAIAFIEGNPNIIQLLREAGDIGYCYFDIKYNPPISIVFRNPYGALGPLGHVLILSAWVNAYNGKRQEVIYDLNATLSISKYLLSNPALLSSLSSVSSLAIAFDAARKMPSNNLLNSDDICDLRIDTNNRHWSNYLQGLKMDFAEELYRLGCGKNALRDLYPCPATDALYRVFLWEGDYASYRKWFPDNFRMEYMSNYPSYRNRRFFRNFSDSKLGPVASMAWFQDGITELAARAEAMYNILLLAKASCLYKRKYADFPESPDKLTPEFLPNLPADPYTGQGLKYLRTKENKVIIYSVGPDLKDDHGADLDYYHHGDIPLVLGK